LRVLFVTLCIVLLDQTTKLLIKGFTFPYFDFYHQGMQLGQSIPVIGDFIRLTFVENPGMVFGIDIGGRMFLALFTLVASIGILYYLYKVRNEALIIRITLAIILGGAIGNFIDRCFYGIIFGYAPLFHGKVVDFIDMDFFRINFLGFRMDRFAVFNVADASVSTGIALILLFYRKFAALDKSAAATTDAKISVSDPVSVQNNQNESKSDAQSSSVNRS
jgi:signal peptidase II